MRANNRGWVVGWFAAAVLFGTAASAMAQLGSGLISQQQAQRGGMERAWFARAHVNPARSAVVRWILSGDQLLVVTNAGVVHALDANTGQTLWVTTVGNPDYPSLGPATNERLVALVNGSTLYLLDRASGLILSERRVGGAPGAGPALAKQFVFVPLVTGRVEGYSLDDPKGTPWFYQSFGRVLVPPRATPQSIVWATDAGLLYVAGANQPGIRFRLETTSEFAAQPAYHKPLIYAVSLAGELFAVDERVGAVRWKYLTGFPTERAPAVVGDRLYVTSDEPMLHSVNATTGLGEWEAPGISQFAAATNNRVYGVDRFGTIHVLDRKTGASVGRYPTGGTLTALVNDQTDRLFLMTDRGLIQCLHEIGAKEPTYYVDLPAEQDQVAEPEEPPVDQPLPEPRREPPTEPTPPQDVEDAFGGSPAEEPDDFDKQDDANPFGVDDDNPFD